MSELEDAVAILRSLLKKVEEGTLVEQDLKAYQRIYRLTPDADPDALLSPGYHSAVTYYQAAIEDYFRGIDRWEEIMASMRTRTRT